MQDSCTSTVGFTGSGLSVLRNQDSWEVTLLVMWTLNPVSIHRGRFEHTFQFLFPLIPI